MASLKAPKGYPKRKVRHYEANHNGEKSYMEVRDTWQGSQYTQHVYEDGSSDTYFGGPCGPIYCDHNGDS